MYTETLITPFVKVVLEMQIFYGLSIMLISLLPAVPVIIIHVWS